MVPSIRQSTIGEIKAKKKMTYPSDRSFSWQPNRDFCRRYRDFAPQAAYPRRQKQSTGLFSSEPSALPPCSNPYVSFGNKTKSTPLRCAFVWQPNRDSNPNIQSQSLLCYRYTIRLCCIAGFIISALLRFVNTFLEKILFFIFILLIFYFTKLQYNISHIILPILQ